MAAYTLYIAGSMVNGYVDAESFDGFESRATGDGLWDYMVDSISFDLDSGYLRQRGISTDRPDELDKETVKLDYYGRRVFTGLIDSAVYDYDTETLSVTAVSMARVVSEIPIEVFSGTHQDINLMVWWLLVLINQRLNEQAYPYRINQTAYIDVQDFPFMRSINARELTGISFASGKSDQQPDLPDAITESYLIDLVYDSLERVYYLYFYAQTATYPHHHYYLVPLSETGPDYSQVRTDLNMYNFPDYTYRRPNDTLDDGILKTLSDKLFANQPYTIQSAAAITDNAYYIILSVSGVMHLVQVTIEQTDRFTFHYENVTAGEIMRDIAKMTNSYVWISPGLTLYYSGRDGLSALPVKQPVQMTVETVRHSESFEAPSAFILLSDVQTALTDYYNTFQTGRFRRYKLTFERDQFSASELPPVLRELPLESGTAGAVKAVTYKEDFIELETEVRVG